MTMKHLTSALLLALTAATLTGCENGKPPPGGNDGLMPQHAKWEKVVDALPFPLSGDAAINQITIGRREYSENYANRGNIEVLFDHPEETITVEIRKYTFGDEVDAFGDEAAGTPGTFDRLSLWAFIGGGNPSPPSAQNPADDCTKDTWKDSCAIYAYYDGKSQPGRSGMDFRVHLPTGYRGKLFVTTEDNADDEQSYPRRGNVTVDGLCSGGEINFEAGRANIKMCRELTPAPTCDAASIAACEDYVDPNTMEPAPWAKECPCGDGQFFGQLLVRAPQPWAANITVDIPDSVWLNSTLQNTSTMKPHDCKPEIEACVDQQIPCTMNADDEYAPTAEFNYPGPSAPQGAGFNLTVISGGCTAIPFVDDPAKWKPEEEGDPEEELRGLLKVCTGCL
jgi:hypothetical protein